MGGSISAGGLITGINSGQLIEQLMQLERQPIIRIRERIDAFEAQRDATREVRTQLLALRNAAQDFRFSSVFDQFQSTSSEESVLMAEVSGTNPVVGSYRINVTQMASATVATSSGVLGGSIDPNVPLASSGIATEVEAGDFTINGITFTVDPATQSLNQILSTINSSGAGVVASYDSVTDKITFENATPGDTGIINFGSSDDDSNFLRAINVVGATQSTGGNGATVATSTRNLGAVDPGETLSSVNFRNGAVTSGSFRINGVQINVDAATDTVSSVIGRINSSSAGVTASYDSATDTIRVVSDTLGSRTVSFTSGTSNFLDMVNLTTAVQDAGDDAQFTINGGPVITRNTNEVSDALGGVVLNLRSVGTSTVTIAADDDAIVEGIQGFIDEYNASLQMIFDQTRVDADLGNDATLRIISSYLSTNVFGTVSGLSGDFKNLLDIGISTGDTFDAGSVALLQLDEDKFREAIRDDRVNVRELFTNTGGTGIADVFEDYLDDVTATSGYLNQRIRSGGTIDDQIESLNTRIERIEMRVEMMEARMRASFARLEQMSAGYQSQNGMISGLSGGFSSF